MTTVPRHHLRRGAFARRRSYCTDCPSPSVRYCEWCTAALCDAHTREVAALDGTGRALVCVRCAMDPRPKGAA